MNDAFSVIQLHNRAFFIEWSVNNGLLIRVDNQGFCNIYGRYLVNVVYSAAVEADLVQMVVDIRIVIFGQEVDSDAFLAIIHCRKIAGRLDDLNREIFAMLLAKLRKRVGNNICALRIVKDSGQRFTPTVLVRTLRLRAGDPIGQLVPYTVPDGAEEVNGGHIGLVGQLPAIFAFG